MAGTEADSSQGIPTSQVGDTGLTFPLLQPHCCSLKNLWKASMEDSMLLLGKSPGKVTPAPCTQQEARPVPGHFLSLSSGVRQVLSLPGPRPSQPLPSGTLVMLAQLAQLQQTPPQRCHLPPHQGPLVAPWVPHLPRVKRHKRGKKKYLNRQGSGELIQRSAQWVEKPSWTQRRCAWLDGLRCLSFSRVQRSSKSTVIDFTGSLEDSSATSPADTQDGSVWQLGE